MQSLASSPETLEIKEEQRLGTLLLVMVEMEGVMQIALQSAVLRRLIQPAWTAPYSAVLRTASFYSRALSGSTPSIPISPSRHEKTRLFLGGFLSCLVEMTVYEPPSDTGIPTLPAGVDLKTHYFFLSSCT